MTGAVFQAFSNIGSFNSHNCPYNYVFASTGGETEAQRG